MSQLAKWPTCKFCISYYLLLYAVETPMCSWQVTSWLIWWLTCAAGSWHISESTCYQSNNASVVVVVVVVVHSRVMCLQQHHQLSEAAAVHPPVWSVLLTTSSIVCHLPHVTLVSHCKTPLFCGRKHRGLRRSGNGLVMKDTVADWILVIRYGRVDHWRWLAITLPSVSSISTSVSPTYRNHFLLLLDTFTSAASISVEPVCN